jgi:hypothetical protein
MQLSFSDIQFTNRRRLKKQNHVIFTTGLNVTFGE